MLTKHKLLVDKNCPMCSIYGNCFTKFKLIDKATLTSYQEVSDDVFSQIDQERAKSEVALFDETTGQTKYGVDAFLFMLSGNSRFWKSFFGTKTVRSIALLLYNFITYNRHVMSGARQKSWERDCTPANNKAYRWAYILVVALVTGLTLNHFTFLVDSQFGIIHQSWRELAVCVGQIVWQFVAISLINSKKRLDYLGNMSTVSLIGALLLLPLLAVSVFISLTAPVLLGYFSLVVMFMLFKHIKRSKNLKLPLTITISWVAFRTIVLATIVLTLIH